MREEPDRLVLLAPNAFHRERIRSHFAPRIGCLASEVGGRPIEVSIELAPECDSASRAPLRCDGSGAPVRSAAIVSERPLAQLALPCTFDTFVTGPSNALAREASLAVAQGRQPALFPLFLVGDSGIGKSHLARAVVAEARRDTGVRAVYASAERFTTEFTSAIRARHGGAFRRRYREECDLLVIDDVQFLSGKEATQLELLHIVEHLRGVGARVVLTGIACRGGSRRSRLGSRRRWRAGWSPRWSCRIARCAAGSCATRPRGAASRCRPTAWSCWSTACAAACATSRAR